VVSYKFVWLLLYALVNDASAALVGWYYAWLAASSSPKPRSSANSRLQQ
jgi:hypothetical protein